MMDSNFKGKNLNNVDKKKCNEIAMHHFNPGYLTIKLCSPIYTDREYYESQLPNVGRPILHCSTW